MHIAIISVGKSKLKEEQVWAQHYLKQLPWKLSLAELPESKAQTAALRKADEAKRILAKLDKAGVVIALDERGALLSSEAFAEVFAKAAVQGNSSIACVIGGADGLDASVLKRAQHTLALGRMTLPHLMARLVLIEQVYRAYTINTGHPYHRR